MAQRTQYSTRALLLLVTCCGVLIAFWTQVVVPAREAARRSQCNNNLFQHSGWHPSDIVSLGQKGEVVSVSSCPLCNTSAAPTVYRSTSGAFLIDAELSPQTIAAARRELVRYKAEPRYRSIRRSFLVADETQAEQRARALWDHVKLKIADQQRGAGSAEPARAPEPAAGSAIIGTSPPPAR